MFDLSFLVIFIWAAFRGFTKGFLIQAATFGALILGIFGAVKFSGFTSDFLINKTSMSGEYMPLISFGITFILIVILIHLSSRLIERLVEAVALGFVNRLLGAVFNMTKFALIISGTLVILNTIHQHNAFLPQKEIDKSILYHPLSNLAPKIFPYLNFNEAKEIIDKVEPVLTH